MGREGRTAPVAMAAVPSRGSFAHLFSALVSLKQAENDQETLNKLMEIGLP
jgi:hypothetical protein